MNELKAALADAYKKKNPEEDRPRNLRPIVNCVDEKNYKRQIKKVKKWTGEFSDCKEPEDLEM